MAYWIYKCNRKPTTYSSDTGDWASVFKKPWKSKKWGTLAEHPDLIQVAKGDLLLCQQSDVAKKLLVGMATVLGVRVAGRVNTAGNNSAVAYATEVQANAGAPPMLQQLGTGGG